MEVKEAVEEREGALEAEAEEVADLSILKDGKLNKGGNVISEDGKVLTPVVVFVTESAHLTKLHPRPSHLVAPTPTLLWLAEGQISVPCYPLK